MANFLLKNNMSIEIKKKDDVLLENNTAMEETEKDAEKKNG